MTNRKSTKTLSVCQNFTTAIGSRCHW